MGHVLHLLLKELLALVFASLVCRAVLVLTPIDPPLLLVDAAALVLLPTLVDPPQPS